MIEILSKIPEEIPADMPVLIAGPTASGKSELALRIAETGGGVIVNADALQVFDCWKVLTARPDDTDLARADHALYGHVPYRESYSTGAWLRDVTPYLSGETRPIIVGGTGLNFSGLTEGLAPIPAIPDAVRQQADALPQVQQLVDLDADTLARIDTANPARVQRAWEVQRATGRSITDWQRDTPPALLARTDCVAIVLDAERDWLAERIARRFDVMLENGAMDEARSALGDWDPTRPSAKAIGAPELVAHLKGELSLEQAKERAIIASRQYAKRQRTWIRSRMGNWDKYDARLLKG